ncbi:hypothetical protein FB451DRAFT_1178583 [Mycena latifolia]|nr:hypothetical protein FB451DRAFT_1178583 [Mycena latifolia]
MDETVQTSSRQIYVVPGVLSEIVIQAAGSGVVKIWLKATDHHSPDNECIIARDSELRGSDGELHGCQPIARVAGMKDCAISQAMLLWQCAQAPEHASRANLSGKSNALLLTVCLREAALPYQLPTWCPAQALILDYAVVEGTLNSIQVASTTTTISSAKLAGLISSTAVLGLPSLICSISIIHLRRRLQRIRAGQPSMPPEYAERAGVSERPVIQQPSSRPLVPFSLALPQPRSTETPPVQDQLNPPRYDTLQASSWKFASH